MAGRYAKDDLHQQFGVCFLTYRSDTAGIQSDSYRNQDTGPSEVYVPDYEDIGLKMGEKAYRILDLKENPEPELNTLPCRYVFDAKVLEELGFENKELPEGSVIINKEPTFFEIYKNGVRVVTVHLLYPITRIVRFFVLLLQNQNSKK